ncbi:hypothetical protein, partial [Escherichia coli]|uniref:hypothetical protein n=2 Tax=Pseudomonadota TaxID=1224 RepID=UPI001BC84DE7
MNRWLRSNEIAALSDQPDWPTADTAHIWKKFRNDALSGATSKWKTQDWTMQGDVPNFVDVGMPGRIE